MHVVRRCVLVILSCVLVGPACAWGPLGHAIVADLAQRHLSPAARAAVIRLLAPEHTTELATVASWADQIRDDPAQAALWQQTRRQHYVDFHGARCRYEPPRDCADGQCVVAALAHHVAVLGDPAQGDAARREALKFVVHFVGDIHQPLHAGYRDDKGGNTYQIRFDGRGSNLHRVWDSGLLDRRGLDAAAYAQLLDSRGPPPATAPLAPLDVAFVEWAQESCRLTAQPGFYPRGHRIGQAYVVAELPVADLRLRVAGLRLAAVLNLAFAAGSSGAGSSARLGG